MNNKPGDSPLLEADVRAMVRLLGEVCAVPGGHAEKKRRLLNGLRELTDADCSVWCLVAETSMTEPPALVNFMHDGFSEERFAKFLEASHHPGSTRNTAAIMDDVRRLGRQQTRLREQLIPTADFLASSAYQAWCDADVSGVLLSIRPIDAVRQSAIGLYRSRDKPLFTERESRIAHILLSEVPWLHELGWPEDRGVTVPELTSRERLALNLLIEGHTRSEIATHLGISLHTAGDYVKTIYHHFGVHSQAELLHRSMQGDGGDIAE